VDPNVTVFSGTQPLPRDVFKFRSKCTRLRSEPSWVRWLLCSPSYTVHVPRFPVRSLFLFMLTWFCASVVCVIKFRQRLCACVCLCLCEGLPL
jgi:hypothetical protein